MAPSHQSGTGESAALTPAAAAAQGEGSIPGSQDGERPATTKSKESEGKKSGSLEDREEFVVGKKTWSIGLSYLLSINVTFLLMEEVM